MGCSDSKSDAPKEERKVDSTDSKQPSPSQSQSCHSGRIVGPLEAGLSTYFINVLVRLEGKTPVSADNLKLALKYAALVHPYMNMKLAPPPEGVEGAVFQFVPQPEGYVCPLSAAEADTSEQCSWEKRFNNFIDDLPDQFAGNLSVRLVIPPASKSAEGEVVVSEIFFSFCHCGSDIKVSYQVETVLQFLGRISAGETIDEKSIESRNFYDPFKMLSQERIAAAKPVDIEGDFLPPVKPTADFGPLEAARNRFRRITLDEQKTAALLKKAHETGASMQSILCAACFVTCASMNNSTNPLPQTALGCIVHDMRPLTEPPLQPEDLITSGPVVMWTQPLAPQDCLWDLASDVRKRYTCEIKEHDAPMRFYANPMSVISLMPKVAMFVTGLAHNPLVLSGRRFGPFTPATADACHISVGAKFTYAMPCLWLHNYSSSSKSLTYTVGYQEPAFGETLMDTFVSKLNAVTSAFIEKPSATVSEFIEDAKADDI